jgi:hypothetical protein
MNMVTEWIGIGLLAVAPIMASAQNQPEMPLVPFNNAAVTPNNTITLALGPNQVGMTIGLTPTQMSASALASFALLPTDKLKVGVGTAGNVATSFKGVRTNTLTPTVGAEISTGAGKFSIGTKLLFIGKGTELEAGPLSFLGLYSNQFGGTIGKVSAEYTPGSQNYQRSGNVIAELISIKDGVGVSGNLKLTEKVKTKISFGIGKSFGNGWQGGISLHPENNFFKGKLNPNLEITKRFGFGRLTGYYAPQTKTMNATVRLNF